MVDVTINSQPETGVWVHREESYTYHSNMFLLLWCFLTWDLDENSLYRR